MSRRSKRERGGLVYSTVHGEMCPRCNRPRASCICKQQPNRAKGNGTVVVGRETKGRKGKGVTVITGVPLPPQELTLLAKRLKGMLGSGGTVKQGVIEIQGDHRDRLVEVLKKEGWTVKRSGG